MKNIKAVCLGLGMTGRQCAEMMLKRGIEIVGAVDAYPALWGKDLGEHLGIGSMGIKIESDLEAVLSRTKPDIVMMATLSMLKDISEQIKICVKSGANVITSSEKAFFWKYPDEKAFGDEIDALAKENGVTVLGTGVQDSNWNIIPLAVSSGCHSIESFEGTDVALVDEFGPAVMNEIGIGMPKAEFEANVGGESELPEPDAFTISLYALIDKLGLTPKSRKVSLEAITSDKPIFCAALNREIQCGELIGTNMITTIETEEGIPFTCKFVSKLSEEGDTAYNKWVIKGVPDLTIVMEDMHGEITTTGAMINRIQDVIAAPAGFLTVNDLPNPYYRF